MKLILQWQGNVHQESSIHMFNGSRMNRMIIVVLTQRSMAVRDMESLIAYSAIPCCDVVVFCVHCTRMLRHYSVRRDSMMVGSSQALVMHKRLCHRSTEQRARRTTQPRSTYTQHKPRRAAYKQLCTQSGRGMLLASPWHVITHGRALLKLYRPQ